jgi:glucosaminylphosphatidylinositol acyltransferase
MDNSLKQQKLNHVSNLNGTTLSDLTLTISMIPIINCFALLFKITVIYLTTTRQVTKWFLFDFTTIIIPFCLILTLASNYLTELQFFLTICTFFLFKLLTSSWFTKKRSVKEQKPEVALSNDDYRSTIIQLTISSFQAMVYVLTAICILAVDFRVFPRRFAKTETYGMSIMDLGVALFIVCHAFKLVKHKFKDETIDEANRLFENLRNTFKSSVLLISFGLLRLASVKLSGYVEHVGEYGVHWNFFFTIALVKLVGCVFQVYIKKSSMRAFLVAIAVLATYQNLLSKKNLSNYMLYKLSEVQLKNASLIDMNKEGLYSCLGYLALYLFGESMALYIYSKIKEKLVNNLILSSHSQIDRLS